MRRKTRITAEALLIAGGLLVGPSLPASECASLKWPHLEPE